MSQTPPAPSTALLLYCLRCGQAFVEMLVLIGHRCAAYPSPPPARRRIGAKPA